MPLEWHQCHAVPCVSLSSEVFSGNALGRSRRSRGNVTLMLGHWDVTIFSCPTRQVSTVSLEFARLQDSETGRKFITNFGLDRSVDPFKMVFETRATTQI